MEENPEKDYLTEYFNFAFILRGHVKDLEAVKAYIVTEYIEQDTLRMINPVYDKRHLYIMTESQWVEYQHLKKVYTEDHMECKYSFYDNSIRYLIKKYINTYYKRDFR